MKNKLSFYNIFVRLRSLSLHLRYLRLALNHDSDPIQEQVETLLQTRHKLDLLQSHLHSIREIIVLRFGQKNDRSSYWSYLVLIELVEQIQQLICSLVHLTEEYFVDPIGVQSCLQQVIDPDIVKLQNRFEMLSSVDSDPKNIRCSDITAA